MSDFNTWLASYNGDHQRAAKDAFDGMQAYIAGHRRMAEDRDALSAHVERLTDLLEEHHEDFMSDGSADWDESDWDGRVAHALEDTPETSLDRLKAGAEQAFADWAEHDLTQDGLFINSEKLLERYRRQAESNK